MVIVKHHSYKQCSLWRQQSRERERCDHSIVTSRGGYNHVSLQCPWSLQKLDITVDPQLSNVWLWGGWLNTQLLYIPQACKCLMWPTYQLHWMINSGVHLHWCVSPWQVFQLFCVKVPFCLSCHLQISCLCLAIALISSMCVSTHEPRQLLLAAC